MKCIQFLLGFLLLLFSCVEKNKEEIVKIECDNQKEDNISSYPSTFFFNGEFKDWVKLRSYLNNNIYPIELIEKSGLDTIKDIFMEYDFGNYYFVSSKFATKTIIPLLCIKNINEFYFNGQLSKTIYDYYRFVYYEQASFYRKIGGKNYSMKMNFELIDEETKTYEVVHKEIYQPNFETAPMVTGRRIFTISLIEGTIEYELEGEFKQEWY